MTDLSPDVQGLLDESYESDLTEEESERLLLMCGHGIGPKLSPAAQQVFWEFNRAASGKPDDWHYLPAIAAALRAAADQLTHRVSILELNMWANELEGFDETSI